MCGAPIRPTCCSSIAPVRRTVKNNADLMVMRGRYGRLSLPLAAMTLYTLQAFAPAGGAGNRTSMRGGGPMVTLIRPLAGNAHSLWRLIWFNVPEEKPLSADCAAEALPWLRPTRTSKHGEIVTPDMSHPAEAFFAMPRRLRLQFEGDGVSGVVQKPHGTNYQGWVHPLSPYYRQKAGGGTSAGSSQARSGQLPQLVGTGLRAGQRNTGGCGACSPLQHHVRRAARRNCLSADGQWTT